MAEVRHGTKADGSGYWYTRVFIGYYPNGKPKQKYISGKTEKDVTKRAKAIEVDTDRGDYFDTKKQRLAGFLEEALAFKAKRLKPASLVHYRYLLDRYIVPELGGMHLTALSQSNLQAWLDRVPTPYLQSRCRMVLRALLDLAVAWERLQRNPADYIEAEAAEYKEPVVWTAEQARAFLAVARGSSYQPYWSLALSIPARPGEIEGLLWEDIDFARGTITIRRNRSTTMNVVHEGTPKTKSSTRTVPLRAEAIQALRAAKVAQEAAQAHLGPSWRGLGLVVVNGRGEPAGHFNLIAEFKRLAKRAKCPDIPLYNLRHTCINLLKEADTDPKTIAMLAGHASVDITWNKYMVSTQQEQRRAAQALDNLLAEPANESVLATG